VVKKASNIRKGLRKNSEKMQSMSAFRRLSKFLFSHFEENILELEQA